MVPNPTRFRHTLLLFLLLLLLAALAMTASAAETGTISASRTHLEEGGMLQLSTNMSGTVTWTSGSSATATVSSTGLVTGITAGQVTITASCPGYTDASITLWVTVPEGVYYLKNASSGLCMETVVDTAYFYTQNTNSTARVSQLWKISYVSNGNYIIRPLGDTSLAMTVGDMGYVSVQKDALVSAGIYWQITHNAFGYAFKHGGSNAKTAMPTVNGPTGVPVYPSSWTSSLTCHWELEEIQGVFLRDTATQRIIPSSTVRALDQITDLITFNDLGLDWEYYGTLSGYSWNPDTPSIATITNNNSISAVAYGKATITLTAIINGVVHTQDFVLCVHISDGTYLIQNKKLATYVQIDDNSNMSTSGSIMELWSFDGGDYQKWNITYLQDGYYSIISAESNLSLTVQSTHQNTSSKSIIQQAYTGLDIQKWTITSTSTGSYVIRPKSGEIYSTDWCLSAGTGIDSDGRNVEQQAYTNNSDYKDEWNLGNL